MVALGDAYLPLPLVFRFGALRVLQLHGTSLRMIKARSVR
jgi:hypothetical protein